MSKEQQAPKLLPCPLFGHLPDKGEFTNGPYVAVSGAPDMPKFYAVVCPGCCSIAYDEDKERVIRKWNTRVRASVAGPPGETGWLLEKMHEGNVHYISADYVLQWTDDPNKALRLARRQDAEALSTIVEDCDKIAAHEWPATISGEPPSCAFCDSGLVFNEQEIVALSDLYERTGLRTAQILKHALALYQLHIVKGIDLPLESKLPPAAAPQGDAETECEVCGGRFPFPKTLIVKNASGRPERVCGECSKGKPKVEAEWPERLTIIRYGDGGFSATQAVPPDGAGFTHVYHRDTPSTTQAGEVSAAPVVDHKAACTCLAAGNQVAWEYVHHTSDCPVYIAGESAKQWLLDHPQLKNSRIFQGAAPWDRETVATLLVQYAEQAVAAPLAAPVGHQVRCVHGVPEGLTCAICGPIRNDDPPAPAERTQIAGEHITQSIRIAIYDWTLNLADDRLAVLTNKDIQALADKIIAAIAATPADNDAEEGC